MRARPAQSLNQRHGSIIVLVLVFVVLLTFIVVAFLEEATATIKYYGLFHNRDDLRTDAYSALEVTLAVVNQYREVEGALWGPQQGWGDPLGQAGFTPASASSVRVTFEDESGRLPLAELDYDALLVLFEVLEFDLMPAQELADGLLDWTDEDDLRRLNGYDGEDYEDEEPPYKPANSPIVTWDEFRLIKAFRENFWDEDGRPTEAWARFKSAVSLYNTGPVNINQAPPVVRAYLEERGLIDSRALDFYTNGADGETGTDDDRLVRQGHAPEGLRLGAGNEVGDTINVLRIKIEAMRGEARFVLETLVSWAGANPGAADATTPGQDQAQLEGQASVETATPGRKTASDRRREARGETRTAPSAAAQLGYPFRIIRLTENRSF